MIFAKKVEAMYRQNLFSRCDDMTTAYYFSTKEFPGLKSEPFSFTANAGHKLQGYFYSYDNPKPNRLVIFDHGLGRGHTSYMREIEVIAKQGYMVFSYDHTGCVESEGANTNGFAQSLNDLDSCLKAIKKQFAENLPQITVIGHSWGGFSTLNILALHPEIKNIVAISGLTSVERMLGQIFSGFMKGYARYIYENVEKKANPEFIKYDALETLANTDKRALIIHSADDKDVKCECHFEVLKSALGDRENLEFWLVNGKAHNPNYTEDAVKYKDEFFATLTKKLKNKELETPQQKQEFVDSYDWWRMTAQDMDVWNKIFEFIEE